MFYKQHPVATIVCAASALVVTPLLVAEILFRYGFDIEGFVMVWILFASPAIVIVGGILLFSVLISRHRTEE